MIVGGRVPKKSSERKKNKLFQFQSSECLYFSAEGINLVRVVTSFLKGWKILEFGSCNGKGKVSFRIREGCSG